MSKLFGVDVSHHQGAIDWPAAKAAGVQFAVIRSSHGMNEIDKQWDANYAGAKAVRMMIGAYHYFYYGDRAKFNSEVANFLSKLSGKSFDLPVFVDFEESGAKYAPALGSLDKATVTEYALYAFEQIRKAGFRPGIYANKYWLTTKIDANRIPADVVVWLAEWKESPTYKGRFELWQYTDKGKSTGITSAGLDMDECYLAVCPYPEPTRNIPSGQFFFGDEAGWYEWHLIRAGYDCGITKTNVHGVDEKAQTETWKAINAVTSAAGHGVGPAGPITRADVIKAAGL